MILRHNAIRHFAQNILGCGCPEEVFQAIHCSDGEAPSWAELCRVDIGNRLLIYLVTPHDAGWRSEDLADLLRAGREDRDAHGFNRFRLACFSDAPPGWLADPDRLTATLYPDDAKVHLHLLPPEDYPI